MKTEFKRGPIIVNSIVILLLALLPGLFHSVNAQRELGVRATASGGPLMPEQAAYDVQSYDLNLRIDPQAQSIKGVLSADVLIVQSTNSLVFDLDAPLAVDSIELVESSNRFKPLQYERRDGKLWISLPATRKKGDKVGVRISYGGKPRVAPRPPWVGGFVWSKTASGEPWLGVACQNDGADLWFPVKDHPADEPEKVTLHFTVPQPLIAASNGRLQSVVKNPDGTQTFNWFVATPINNYGITLNVAPYKTIEDKYTSITGETFPITLWVLPEDFAKGAGLVSQTKLYLRFFEDYLGPYPFRAEKLGIAQTSYLGMENQTIIAYGNHFNYDATGFDWLMFHELGHEWFGNMVTASDWRDFWLHEGFQSFFDTLYVEKTQGPEAYFKAMANRVRGLRNMQPIAPRESRTTVQMYMAAPDYVNSDGDIYGKGAVVLHTLRYLIGDKAFFAAIRRMAYPEPRMEKMTNGKQVRFATTEDFRQIAEEASGKDLGWFFEVYVRQPKLPKLIEERNGEQLVLRWETPNNLAFAMPVEVQMGDATKRYEPVQGKVTLQLVPGQTMVIDPKNWILRSQ